MNELLSVSEARKFTGKSESTIKRMIREITADENHSDRGLIQPTHKELERRKADKEPYVWKIDQSLLERRYMVHETDHDPSQGAGESSTDGRVQSQFIELLQTQLAGKDEQLKTLERQLDRKDEQISNWNERMRETNVLMQTLQQRLEIHAPVSKDSSVINVDTTSATTEAQTTNAENGKLKRMTIMERLRNPLFQKR